MLCFLFVRHLNIIEQLRRIIRLVQLADQVLALSHHWSQCNLLLACIRSWSRGWRHQGLQIQAWILQRYCQRLLGDGLRHLQHAILVLRSGDDLLHLPGGTTNGIDLLLTVLGGNLDLLDGCGRSCHLLQSLGLRHQVRTLERLQLGQIIKRAKNVSIASAGDPVSHNG